MEKEKLLDIKDLSVTYKTEDGIVYAVNNLNLTLEPKETLGFVGETGAGKTTTAMTIMGLLPTPPGKVTSGEIMFDGKDMLKIGDKERRGRKNLHDFPGPHDLLKSFHEGGGSDRGDDPPSQGNRQKGSV